MDHSSATSSCLCHAAPVVVVGAAYSLREILTIKSDDILGRSAAFDAIVSGKRIEETNTPATFNVLVRHLRGLGIDIDFLESKPEL
jgi:DNA-directed RNA polymerase subunit beta